MYEYQTITMVSIYGLETSKLCEIGLNHYEAQGKYIKLFT